MNLATTDFHSVLTGSPNPGYNNTHMHGSHNYPNDKPTVLQVCKDLAYMPTPAHSLMNNSVTIKIANLSVTMSNTAPNCVSVCVEMI